MPHHCVAFGCSNTSRKPEGITFHSFPKNEDLKRMWINAIKRKDWQPSKWSKLCSAHFREIDMDRTSMSCVRVREGAVPGIFPSISDTKDRRPCKRKLPIASTSAIFISGESPTKKLKLKLNETNVALNISRKKVKYLQQCKRRAKKKLARLNDIIDALRKQLHLEEESCTLLNSISKTSHCLIKRSMDKVVSPKLKKKYEDRLRAFAITLHFISPKAYSFVRKTFDTCLPHPRTLRKWYSSVSAEPGLITEVFIALKDHMTNAPNTVCALMLDSMSIRKGLEWDGKKFYGAVNVGVSTDDDSSPLAREALVFHLVAINASWKIPVGYFFVNGISAEQQTGLVKQCLTLLEESGVTVGSLTCDGTSVNIAMACSLGCSFDPQNMISWFPHPDTKKPINFFLDPPHMIKLVRNTFGDYGVLYDDKNNKIEWRFIEELLAVQKEEELHLGNKLTRDHVNFKNQKMKVKLAAQVLSDSVADSLDFLLKNKVQGFETCAPTIKFLRMFNKLFDILNSRSIHGKYHKKAMCQQNFADNLFFLMHAKKFIFSMKDKFGKPILSSKRKTGFLGLIICIDSAISMYKQFVSGDNAPLKYLPLYKTCLDHLERLFGYVRSRGGHNNNPTCKQFTASMKRILLHKELEEGNTGNTLALSNYKMFCIFRKNSEEAEINTSTSSWNLLNEEEQKTLLVDDDGSELVPFASTADIAFDIVEYISGYVGRGISSKIVCETCKSLLFISKGPYSKFSLISCKDRGGLVQPSAGLTKLCNMCESVFRMHIHSDCLKFAREVNLIEKMTLKVLKGCIGVSLFSGAHYLDHDPDQNHVNLLMKAICKKYFTVRLHYFSKRFNHSIHLEKVRKHLCKVVTFLGQ